MPTVKVQRSIIISAPKKVLFELLSDFSQWRAWSPWLIMEPEATVEVAENKRSYAWQGQRVGSGNMLITGMEAGKVIRYDLTFLKPWKSKAKVRFELEDIEGRTRVTWSMDSKLPLLMFWMKGMMEAFIGMDYERGLQMLKEFVETGSVPSTLRFIGEKDFAAKNFVGIRTACDMDEVGPRMEEDFTRLAEHFSENLEQIDGFGFSIYHKFDVVKRKIEYTCGFALKAPLPEASLPEGVIAGLFPNMKIYVLHHTGPYRLLGNAWSTMMNGQRSKLFKPSKVHHPFEIYLNDPSVTPENELETEICFAVK